MPAHTTGKALNTLENKSFLEFLNDEYKVFSQRIQNSIPRFQRLKIGNYIHGKVKLVKDYGLILEIEGEVTGFVMTGMNTKQLKEYKMNEKL